MHNKTATLTGCSIGRFSSVTWLLAVQIWHSSDKTNCDHNTHPPTKNKDVGKQFLFGAVKHSLNFVPDHRSLGLSHSDRWGLGHILDKDPSPQIGVSNLFYFRMIEATVLLGTFRMSFLRSAPRCNLSLSSADSSHDLVFTQICICQNSYRQMCVCMSRQLK